jgi:uncharacterized Tic20 family protein
MSTNDRGNAGHEAIHVRADGVERDEVRVQKEPNPIPAWSPVAVEGGGLPSTDAERTEAVVCHVGGILTSFLLPLIMLLIKKDRSAFVAHHGREALNFQFTLFVPLLASGLLALLAGVLGWMVAPEIAVLAAGLVCVAVAVAVCLWEAVFAVVASVAAYRGRDYYYPLCIRFIR